MKKFSDKAQGVIFIVLIIFGIGLVTTGLIMPPMGVIDNSVIIVFGEILSFCGAILGIDRKYDVRERELERKFVQKDISDE